jgi:hypothetical protein
MIATSFERFKNLPENRNIDAKTLYKRWLVEENKLLMMFESFQLTTWTVNNATGAANPPRVWLTYFQPNGRDGITLGYYTPDTNTTVGSSYFDFTNVPLHP